MNYKVDLGFRSTREKYIQTLKVIGFIFLVGLMVGIQGGKIQVAGSESSARNSHKNPC